MAIEATIRRGYAARLIVIAVVCGVLGAWGVYDYAVTIPRKQVLFGRVELLRQCRGALETEQAAGSISPEARSAAEAVDAELHRILQAEFDRVQQGREAITTEEQLQKVAQELGPAIETSPEAEWIGLLMTIRPGLIAERRLPLENYPEAQKAFEAARSAIDRIGEITEPSQLDRATQWAFILCLPCVPYMLWMFAATRRRVYRLDDAGTLQAPEGTWKSPDIADIDMSRWMAKSIAWVVLNDGTRIKLDDYRFKDLHLIIGAIAARLHGDEWDAQAKPVRKEQPAGADGEDESDDAGNGDGDDNGG